MSQYIEHYESRQRPATIYTLIMSIFAFLLLSPVLAGVLCDDFQVQDVAKRNVKRQQCVMRAVVTQTSTTFLPISTATRVADGVKSGTQAGPSSTAVKGGSSDNSSPSKNGDNVNSSDKTGQSSDSNSGNSGAKSGNNGNTGSSGSSGSPGSPAQAPIQAPGDDSKPPQANGADKFSADFGIVVAVAAACLVL